MYKIAPDKQCTDNSKGKSHTLGIGLNHFQNVFVWLLTHGKDQDLDTCFGIKVLK